VNAAVATLSPVVTLLLAGTLAVPAVGVENANADRTFKPFRLKTPEGASVTLAEVLDKATLVVFFFPSCTYCSLALPEMQRLHDAYIDDGLSVVWINVLPEQARLVPGWRSRHGYRVPILLGGRSVQKDYALTMTPTHYLLDGDGNVVARQAGFKRGDQKELERQIQEVLGLKPPPDRLPIE
jgi:thiol-disulfide isomerase/thioredoxin